MEMWKIIKRKFNTTSREAARKKNGHGFTAAVLEKNSFSQTIRLNQLQPIELPQFKQR